VAARAEEILETAGGASTGEGGAAGRDVGGGAVEEEWVGGSTHGIPHLRVQDDKGFGAAEPHKILVDDQPLAGDNPKPYLNPKPVAGDTN
jgi:hypothetical protein